MSWGGRDFTRGATLRQLATFSGPIVLANLLQTLFQLVDSLWVGNLLGAQALGAVAISGTVIFVALAFVIGMNNAALAILAQHKGRRDERAFARYLNAFTVILLGASVLLGLAGFLGADGALRLLGTPAQILAPARDYLQITFVGMLFLFGYNFLATVLRAIGDSATPLRFTVAAVALNTVLDPLLIHTAGWGVRGAALATVVSQGVAFGYGLVHVARRRLVPAERPHPPAAAEVRMVLRLGIPAGLQMAVISAGSAAIMSVVAAFGAEVVGGYGAAQRLDALVMLPAQALGIAVQSMAAQNIGRRAWDRVGELARVAVLANFLVMVVIGLVVVALADVAVGLFIDEPRAAQFGASYVRIVALCYPFLGINFVLNGIVRASGAMYQVLVLNIVSFWVLRYPLTAIGAHVLDETGIGVGVGASFVVSSAVAYAYFRWGRWREKQLFDEPAETAG